MSFAEVEKYRMLQRASEPLREIELERRRLVEEAGAWAAEEVPLPASPRSSWREWFGGLLHRKTSTRTSSSAT